LRNGGTRQAIRVGVLTPHTAVGPEEELPAMAPRRIVTCVVRVPADDVRADPATLPGLRELATSPVLDQAAAIFARGSLDVLGYASTSSAYAIGFDAERELVSRLSRRLGIPVAATSASAVLALRVLGVERVALVHPPWFDAELNELGTAYFESQALEVVSSASASLSRDPSRVEATDVYEWTALHVSAEAEGVFIGGNGFRAAGAIAALEARVGRPVLTSNQVLLWRLLAQVGAIGAIDGYGRLFSHTAQPAGR
jgi:maleate isomerase